MNKIGWRQKASLALMAFFIFSLGTAFTRRQAVPSQFNKLVDEAWEAINAGYYDPNFGGANWTAIRSEFLSGNYGSREEAYSAIRRMLARLNSPATRFLTGEQVAALLSELNLRSHIGTGLLELLVVDVGEQSRKLQIITTVPDTPARREGLQPGDWIFAIDGVQTDGLGLTEAMERLRGPEGTTVKLTVQRSENRFEVQLPRQKMPAIERTVRAEIRQWRGQRIGYIRLDLFLNASVEQMREAVRKMEEERVSGLILDLRNNPGGDVRSCLQIAALFLGDVPLANVKGREGLKPLHAIGERITRLPLNALVNKGTASAAELLAVALQSHQRGAIVGQTTFGKGLIHRGAQLSDGSMLLITSGSMRTLKGVEILGHGITPDVKANPGTERDEQWIKAADLLLRRRPETAPAVKK